MNKLSLRKNILDSDLQINLQISSISVIIIFTYFIGIIIAFLSHQIQLNSFIDMGLAIIISTVILSISAFFLIPSINKIRKIRKALRNMEKTVLD